MSRHKSELTDAQWAYIAPLLPEVKASPKGGPKPIPNRPVFEGILWVFTQWGPLERSAGSVSLPQYLLAPLTRLGRAGCLAKGLARAAQTTG